MSYLQVLQAAASLAVLYRHVEPRIRGALAYTGLTLRQGIPCVNNDAAPSIDQGIAAFTAQVKDVGILVVSGEFSSRTIYPTAQDNHWFRHVHDMAHILYQCEFDSEGESKLHPLLWRWIETTPFFWSLPADMQAWVRAVYYADTQGQTDYFDKHGAFPNNQRVFVAEAALRAHQLEQQTMHKHEGILVIAYLPDGYPHSEVEAELVQLGVSEDFLTKVADTSGETHRVGYAAKVNLYDEALDLRDSVLEGGFLCCKVYEKTDPNPWMVVQ